MNVTGGFDFKCYCRDLTVYNPIKMEEYKIKRSICNYNYAYRDWPFLKKLELQGGEGRLSNQSLLKALMEE